MMKYICKWNRLIFFRYLVILRIDKKIKGKSKIFWNDLLLYDFVFIKIISVWIKMYFLLFWENVKVMGVNIEIWL